MTDKPEPIKTILLYHFDSFEMQGSGQWVVGRKK